MDIHELKSKYLAGEDLKKVNLWHAYGMVNALNSHIGHMVLLKDELHAEEGLKMMAKFYDEGNQSVKAIVENLFVHSLGTFMATCVHMECRRLIERIPENLHAAYINQLCRRGL